MKRRAKHQQLRLITEMSFTPLLDLVFVLLLLAAVSAPLLQFSARQIPTSAPFAKREPLPMPPETPSVERTEPPSAAAEVGTIKSPPSIAAPSFTLTGAQRKVHVFIAHPRNDLPDAGKMPPAASMTTVDEALVSAFRQNLALPEGVLTSDEPRTVHMDFLIARDGSVLSYILSKPSGQAQMDMSVLRAAGLIKRISVPLPAEFSGDSHEVQMHVRAE